MLKAKMEAELRQGTKSWPHLAKCFWQEPEGMGTNHQAAYKGKV